MALLEDVFEEALGPVAIGIGALIVVPALFPGVRRALRPVAKGAIKAGIAFYETTLANVTEAAGDLIAEARAEREQESPHGEQEHEASRRRERPARLEQEPTPA
ncbi:DUF5132 domain-containing protein [Methylosinus sp. Sm6]|uniref:DUF5132 domain-containing protein n=1 Tax=Methylosinus sp. Sm6 TaxID=2866948 RepID=UPI002102D421|nr:DUF5132 domain-containing protein [Methylosinus sp. Sm6]